MKLEKTLVEMVCHFTPARASDWLRILFSSFETDLEPIAVDTTKNESAYFAEARRLGWVARLPETDSAEAANKPLVVVAVKMKGDLTERTSRLVQFAFAKKVVQNAIARGSRGIHGLPTQGLFFFYDADGYFRISLVHGEADGRKLKYNSAKRQSFYVDPTAANNILRRRLGDTIKTFAELKNAFSVEQLTKEFYGRLFEWYTWALAPRTGVTFPNDLADEKDDRKYNHEAIIRLITRLMFTWFIRQKIPALKELFNPRGLDEILKGNRGKGKFNPDSMEDDNYYRCILQNLFFATFNCPQSGKGKLLRRWINVDLDERGDGKGLSDDFNVTTVYRYRNEFKNPDAFLENMRSVPFLNCALFDCLDKAERKQDGGRKLYFDGFSTKIKRQAHVPNGLFFKEGQGLIDLFNGYEFTIDENSADDADVALDPELLGKVFENLLGAFNRETQETARKATGSFYTPREIVDYMVEESLKNYLKGQLPETTKDIDAKLDDLFDRTKAAEGERTMFSRKDEETLLNALYDCKVLDPACGSGAFPMGVLHCMVRLLARLDPDSISIRERLIARYRADKDSVDPAESAADRRERLAELEKCLDEGQHYPDYARKLYLIENCIYGVDIQPIATQISKLRFFISLLCDQFRTSFNGEDANYGLLALPNLEAKFVCANTLISLPETSGELDLTASGVMEARERLKINRHRIFGARSTGTKEKYKKRDLEIRDEIREAVINGLAKPDESVIAASEKRINELMAERESYEMPHMVKVSKMVAKPTVQYGLFDAPPPPKEHEASEVEVEELVDENESKRNSIDSQIYIEKRRIEAEQNKSKAFNVTAAQDYAKLVAGWDPFDQNASSEFFDPEWMFNITDGFDVVIGNPPYGKIFTDEVNRVVGNRYKFYSDTKDAFVAFMGFAIDAMRRNGVMHFIIPSSWHGGPAYRSLREFCLQNTILNVIELPFDMFDNAYIDTSIIGMSKRRPLDGWQVVAHRFHHKDVFSVEEANHFEHIEQRKWELVHDKKFILANAFIDLECHLSNIKTTLGDFIEAKRGVLLAKDSISDKKTAQKNWRYFKGDVYRYELNEAFSWIAFGSGFKEGPKVETWYKGNRILLRRLMSRAHRLMATIARGTFVTNKNLYILKPKDNAVDLRLILGIVNSRLYSHLYSSRVSGAVKDDFPQVTMSDLFVLPCPILGKIASSAPTATVPATKIQSNSQSAVQLRIATLVEKVLAEKAREGNTDTSSLEAEIDQLVYKLYDLTDDEIAIVEGRNEIKQEPQGDSTRRSVTSPRRRRQSPAPAPTESPDDEVLE